MEENTLKQKKNILISTFRLSNRPEEKVEPKLNKVINLTNYIAQNKNNEQNS